MQCILIGPLQCSTVQPLPLKGEDQLAPLSRPTMACSGVHFLSRVAAKNSFGQEDGNGWPNGKERHCPVAKSFDGGPGWLWCIVIIPMTSTSSSWKVEDPGPVLVLDAATPTRRSSEVTIISGGVIQTGPNPTPHVSATRPR